MGRFSLLFIVLFFVCSVGCSSGKYSERGESISKASKGVERAVLEALGSVSGAYQRILLRYNPCDCDESVPYEIFAYGFWHRVHLIGKAESLRALSNEMQGNGVEVVKEVRVKLSDRQYLGFSGQYFWQVEFIQ